VDIVKIFDVQNVLVLTQKKKRKGYLMSKTFTIKDIVRIKNSPVKYRVQDIKYIGFSRYLLLENMNTYEVIEFQNSDLLIKVK